MSLKKCSFGIPAPLEARGCSKGLNISQKHCQTYFFGWLHYFQPNCPFWHTQCGPREDEIPSKQPLASATALKVRLPYRTVLTQGGKLIIHPVCCRILYSEFSPLILSIFGRVWQCFDWYPALWSNPEPPVKQESLKSVFLETPCSLSKARIYLLTNPTVVYAELFVFFLFFYFPVFETSQMDPNCFSPDFLFYQTMYGNWTSCMSL